MDKDDLREKVEAAIRSHLEWPDSANKTSEIADDIMAIIEQERFEDCRSTVLDIETREQ